MPRLKMPSAPQAIFDELDDYLNGARMINSAQLARFWGRDVRSVRAWLAEKDLNRVRMGNMYSYSIRDISREMYLDAR